MNKEEIKNIFATIDKIYSPYYEISRERMYKIKECIEDLYNQLQNKKQENLNLQQELTDYKERNENAIELIKEKTEDYKKGIDLVAHCLSIQDLIEELEEVLEILDKKDKE